MSKEAQTQLVEIFKALGNPVRLAIADFLTEGEHCVQEITKQLDVKQSVMSRHLAVLRYAGIVEAERRGLKVYYSLALPSISEFSAALSEDLSG